MATAKRARTSPRGRLRNTKGGKKNGKEDREEKAKKHCRGRDKLDPKKVCEFLKELELWLAWFVKDYEKVRVALCNVEREAFAGAGDPNKRFCKGGTGNDPVPPEKPPTWG